MLESLLGVLRIQREFPYSGPGPKFLKTGNTDSGYFGVLTPEQFPVAQPIIDQLLSSKEWVAPQISTQALTIEWHKFFFKKKIIYMPRYAFVRNVTAQALYSAGMLHGDILLPEELRGFSPYLPAHTGEQYKVDQSFSVGVTEDGVDWSLTVRSPRVNNIHVTGSLLSAADAPNVELSATYNRMYGGYGAMTKIGDWTVATVGYLENNGVTITAGNTLTSNFNAASDSARTMIRTLMRSPLSQTGIESGVARADTFWLTVLELQDTPGFTVDFSGSYVDGSASAETLAGVIVPDPESSVVMARHLSNGYEAITTHRETLDYAAQPDGVTCVEFDHDMTGASVTTLEEIVGDELVQEPPRIIDFDHDLTGSSVTPIREVGTFENVREPEVVVDYKHEHYVPSLTPIVESITHERGNHWFSEPKVEFPDELLIGEALWHVMPKLPVQE